MKILPLLAFLLLAFTPSLAQGRLREADLKVRGVGSGSSYNSVLANFGRPSSKKIEQYSADNSSCIPEAHTLVKLHYPGLTVELLGDGVGRKLRVVEIDVTSHRWSASSVRVGARADQVVRRFGKPNSHGLRVGWIAYYYVTPGNLGSVVFEFRKGRLTRISMSETLC